MEVFDLNKEKRFNIKGEFTVEVVDEKQKYKFVAIHPNRTIVWTSDYSSLEAKTYQSSKIELAKDIWLGYNVEVLNHTSNDAESQELKVKLSYPARDISVGGFYNLKDDSFDTDLTVQWLKKETKSEEDGEESTHAPGEPKTIQGKLQWRDLELNTKSKDHQSIVLGLKHPSFERDLALQGSYYREEFKLAKIAIDYDYTEEEDHHAQFKLEVQNLSEDVGYKNYTMSAMGLHPASELNLILDGSIGLKPNNYKIEATGLYKRGYLPEMELEMLGFIDIDNKEIKFYVRSNICFKKLSKSSKNIFSAPHRTSRSTSTASRQPTSQSTQSMESTSTALNMTLKARSFSTLARSSSMDISTSLKV